MKDYRNEIEIYIEHEIETLRALDKDAINDALNLLLETMEKGNTVFVFGNGGSSATASHFQNDFNKGVSEHTEKKFNFLCLNDNVATMMAVANDIGFEEVFRFQLRGHIKPGDVVLAISGSGNSKNVINAVEYAKEQGCRVIGLTGFGGGKLRQLADVSLHAPINSMQVSLLSGVCLCLLYALSFIPSSNTGIDSQLITFACKTPINTNFLLQLLSSCGKFRVHKRPYRRRRILAPPTDIQVLPRCENIEYGGMITEDIHMIFDHLMMSIFYRDLCGIEHIKG